MTASPSSNLFEQVREVIYIWTLNDRLRCQKEVDIGDVGDVGDVGDMGDMGDTGDTGDIGDKGDIGDVGDISETGDIGDQSYVMYPTTEKTVFRENRFFHCHNHISCVCMYVCMLCLYVLYV